LTIRRSGGVVLILLLLSGLSLLVLGR